MSLMNHPFSIFGYQRSEGSSYAAVIPRKYACVKALSHWRSCALWLVGVQVAFSGVFVLVDPLEDPTLTGCRLHRDRRKTACPRPGLDTTHRHTRARRGVQVGDSRVVECRSEGPARQQISYVPKSSAGSARAVLLACLRTSCGLFRRPLRR